MTETLTSWLSELSLNFGNGNGWSYLSGGVGVSRWSIVPAGAAPLPIDNQWRKTINYGGGARWFAKKRLAFSLDVRFYEIAAGTAQLAASGQPADQAAGDWRRHLRQIAGPPSIARTVAPKSQT